MVIEVKDISYMGFDLHYIEKQGWKIVLHDAEILFPTMQDAKAAVNEFYRDVVPKHKGKKVL